MKDFPWRESLGMIIVAFFSVCAIISGLVLIIFFKLEIDARIIAVSLGVVTVALGFLVTMTIRSIFRRKE